MIFMQFKEFKFNDLKFTETNKIWIQLDHIVSVRECPNQVDRSWIELSSGTRHEVAGCAEDILKEIVNECRERRD